MQQFLIGISGAVVGVVGWLFVGMFIQRRAHDRQARDAGRAVYFELSANHLAVFTAWKYGLFGTLSRATFDRLLPELSTWLPAPELQALVVAYLGHSGFEQAARDEDVPADVRQMALAALLESHRVAVRLLRARVFTRREMLGLDAYVDAEYARLMRAADSVRPEEVDHARQGRRAA